MTTNGPTRARRRRALVLGITLAAVPLGACDELLDVENPQVIQPEQLDEEFYLGLLTSGVVGDFHRAQDDVVFFSGVFTDELHNHTIFEEEPRIDQRNVDPANGVAALVYTQLQRSRALADSTVDRFDRLRGEAANADLRLARVLAYGGMTYTLMGETLCDAPVGRTRGYTPRELLETYALPRYQRAITVATAARAQAAAATPVATATVAGADSVLNLARVGAARAALNLFSLTGSDAFRQQAAQYASQVPANYLAYAYYSDTAAELNNLVWSRLTNTRAASVTNTPFAALSGVDPRVPIPTVTETVQGGSRALVPNAPTAYSAYSGTLPGAEFAAGSFIRIASGLEARYIRAEAEGATAENIAFVEGRRQIAPGTAGTPAATQPTTAANYGANLRDQRRRDLYLDGHRLGDLRRYREQFGNNVEEIHRFQTGLYPGSTTVSYADQFCFTVNLAEINGNPNYQP